MPLRAINVRNPDRHIKTETPKAPAELKRAPPVGPAIKEQWLKNTRVIARNRNV